MLGSLLWVSKPLSLGMSQLLSARQALPPYSVCSPGYDVISGVLYLDWQFMAAGLKGSWLGETQAVE